MIIPFLLLASLAGDMEILSRPAKGHVGVAAQVIGTKQIFGFHESEHFPMQSVYKFPIAMAVLNAVDHGQLALGQTVRVTKGALVPEALHSPIRDEHHGGEFDTTVQDLLRYAVSESDGTASDALLRVLGGPAKVQQYLTTLGVTEVRIVNTEMEMSTDDALQYQNWATPRGMVQLLRLFQQGRSLSRTSQELLMGWMTDTTTGPQRIKGLLPNGTSVAHKTGTSQTRNGVTAATNDVGLVSLPLGRGLLVAIFVSDSPADTAVREGVIAKIASALYRQQAQRR